MADNRTGKYRLLRQIHGRGAFGEVHVQVRASRSGDDPRVVWAVEGSDETSAQPSHDPAETSAALEGARLGLALVESLDRSVQSQTVLVTFVGINVADTEPSAVRAAASAAVVQAFGLEGMCRLVYEHGWHYVPNSHA